MTVLPGSKRHRTPLAKYRLRLYVPDDTPASVYGEILDEIEGADFLEALRNAIKEHVREALQLHVNGRFVSLEIEEE